VVVFLAIVVLVLPTTSVKVFAATVIPTLECFPPRLNGTNSGNSVTIILKNVAYTTDLLTNLIVNGNLVLEAVKPTLMITGSGGANTTAVVVFLAIVVLVLPTTSVKVFAATVIPTLECFPPRLGVTILN
jgi:hypothetical protein